MKSQDRSIVYLKEYRPPTHVVNDFQLIFDIFDDGTRVSSRMKIEPNSTSQTLELAGQDLRLESVRLDNEQLKPKDYELDEKCLKLKVPVAPFELEIVTWIEPEKNTELSGLYSSKGLLCTQCEAEGFRRITYFLDRPDVMTVYTTTIRADAKKFPLLLSNGNKISTRILDEGRHEVVWQDPHKKPSYLFALVAGHLECVEDYFLTQSGRRVTLQIFVESGNQDKVHHAMESLKNSMRWDETTYGREYDLDIFMIVAVDDFNSGAMENKGLNIFNSKYILANPETATDTDFEHIEGVVAHEYFHNWTGNRITCRDWFQLSLKEGLTVFRDQEFSSDMNSRAVKRIHDVNMLRTHQFAEDAGPMAHPIRPASYMEINNFYTLTVYEKGSEVIRMIHTLIGPDLFRKGMDKYFELFDGQAVTTEDFVRAMEVASGRDLSQFKNWYNQAGTPEVFAEERYDASTRNLTITLRQRCRPTPESPNKKPFVIPVKIALVTNPATVQQEQVLEFSQVAQEFIFKDVKERPVVSYLRGFSAPVQMHTPHATDELQFLLANDNDSFQRWESLQKLWQQWILSSMTQTRPDTQALQNILKSLRSPLLDSNTDPALRALLLSVPNEVYFQTLIDSIHVETLHSVRDHLVTTMGSELEGELAELYQWAEQKLASLPAQGLYSSKAAGLRALKNSCLKLLVRANPRWTDKAYLQLQNATNMTDEFDALVALTLVPNQHRTSALQLFYSRWKDNFLVINKWLTVQAMIGEKGTFDQVKVIAQNKNVFDRLNPNKVYSLLVAYSQQNIYGFHANGSQAYDFIANEIIEIDRKNPQVASRLARTFNHWRRYAEPERGGQKDALERIRSTTGLSRNVFEIVDRALEVT